MVYPPLPHREKNLNAMAALIREFPFAHFITAAPTLNVTRLPFALDTEEGSLVRLRAHMNAQNPQAKDLDGADVLVAFSGPDSYVSPNWRRKADRGATWDYTAVHVWGKAHVRPERTFFEQLVDDTAGPAETAHQGASQKENWRFAHASDEYVDRLRPQLTAFEITIDRVEGISKLHQDFPKEDAAKVAKHLDKSPGAYTDDIAALIRSRIKD